MLVAQGIPLSEALPLAGGPDLGDGTLADSMAGACPRVNWDALREAEDRGVTGAALEAMGACDPRDLWGSLGRFVTAGIPIPAGVAFIASFGGPAVQVHEALRAGKSLHETQAAGPVRDLLETAARGGRLAEVIEALGSLRPGSVPPTPAEDLARVFRWLHLRMTAGATILEAVRGLEPVAGREDTRSACAAFRTESGDPSEVMGRRPDVFPPAVTAIVRARAERDGDPVVTFRLLAEAIEAGLLPAGSASAAAASHRQAFEDLSTEGFVGLAAFEAAGRVLAALERIDAGTGADAIETLRPVLADLLTIESAFEKGLHPRALQTAFGRIATVARALLGTAPSA